MDGPRVAVPTQLVAAAGSRRGALAAAMGSLLGLARLVGPTAARKKHKHKHKKKRCARVGQRTRKRRKKCCRGLVKDGAGRCTQPASPSCVPRACPATGCGDLPDGCGGTLSCGCPANQICLRRGVCRPCTVTCTGTPAQCGVTLRTAINDGGTVYVCPGRYQGGFVLTDAVTVIGAGEGTDAARDTILDGNAAGRVLTVNAGAGRVVLERLRISGGNSDGGSGIDHGGSTLHMRECTVSDNTSVDSSGGGILVETGSTLEMTRCTVRDNRATSQTGVGTGGGIHAAGTTTLTDCLIEANEAANSGGGLYVIGGTTTLLGTTQVRQNNAGLGGGIAVATGTNVSGVLIVAETCRVTENMAGEGFGGGIRRSGGTVTLRGANPSPIVVNNCHENCAGTVSKCAATPVSC
jgi:hypothetical protein